MTFAVENNIIECLNGGERTTGVKFCNEIEEREIERK